MATTGAVVARILTQYSDKGSKQAQKDIQKLGRNIDAFGKKATRAFAAVGVASALMAIKIGKDAVKAATEEARAQAILANNLRNVTGATDATIKSVEDYIDKQEMLSTVSDTELRQSFGALVTASGDVEQAMRMQTVALDVAAGTGKDVQSVTMALVKAQNGQFGSLTKLGVPLDANLVKTKNLEAIVAKLSETYEGSAKIVGDQEPLKRLAISYTRVLEALGKALLPAVEYFVAYLISDVLPAVERWIELNEVQLQQSLKDTADLLVNFTKDTAKLLEVLIKYESVVKALSFAFAGVYTSIKLVGGVIGVLEILRKLRTMKITYGLSRGTMTTIKEMGKFKTILSTINASKFVTAVKLIGAAMLTLRASAIRTAVALAFATGGASLATAGIALAAIGITAVSLNYALDKNAESAARLDKGLKALSKDYGGLPDVAEIKEKARQDKIAAEAARKKAIADAASAKAKALQEAADKKAAAAAAKKAKFEKQAEDLKKRIQDKYNVRITDADQYEAIQLNAVEKLLAKQKDADSSLAERIKLRKEELALFNALNQNAQRYTDLLQALADEKLSNQEIELLAKKWGLTVDAAKSYIYTVFAIKDEVVSDDEVARLAEAWGVTKAQAGQYLDFFAALNDGKLSDVEIAKLMTKWGLTREEAVKYSDFVSKLGDGQLSQKDLDDLKSNWGLTNEQVVEYIKQIGVKVDASGTILSAGDIAALGWTNALNALNAYLAALGKGTGGTPQNPVIPPVVVPIVPKVDGSSRTDSAATAAAAASSKAAAEYAAAQARGDMNAAAIAAAKVGPSALASQESGAIGAASIAAQLRAAEAAQAAARQASSLAAFKAKEAADLEASQAAARAMDYDEKFRFMGSSTLNTAKSLMASGMNNSTSAPNIVINVAGSVTSEQDLVQSVRNGLLAAQTNGQGLTLQAI